MKRAELDLKTSLPLLWNSTSRLNRHWLKACLLLIQHLYLKRYSHSHTFSRRKSTSGKKMNLPYI
jgi:hypothetical protein